MLMDNSNNMGEEKNNAPSTTLLDGANSGSANTPQVTNNINVAGMQAPKKSNTLTIVLALIVVVLGVLVALLATGVIGGEKKDNGTGGDNTSETSQQETPKANIYSGDKIEAEAITDETLKNSLKDKTNKILGKDEFDAFLLFGKNVAAYQNISAELKAGIATARLDRTEPTDEQWNAITDEHLAKLSESLSKDTEYARSMIRVAGTNGEWRTEYENLFGEFEVPKDGFTTPTGCPRSIYVEEIDGFISSVGCGGVYFTNNRAYIYDYQQDNDYAYVYVAGAIAKGSPETGTYTVEKGFDGGERVVSGEGDANNFTLDASNYQDYTHYRLAFEKTESGNYIFKTMVQINE